MWQKDAKWSGSDTHSLNALVVDVDSTDCQVVQFVSES